MLEGAAEAEQNMAGEGSVLLSSESPFLPSGFLGV